jgi:hypothetical protein
MRPDGGYTVIDELYKRALELAVEVYDADQDHMTDILPLAKHFADFLKDGVVPKEDADA